MCLDNLIVFYRSNTKNQQHTVTATIASNINYADRDRMRLGLGNSMPLGLHLYVSRGLHLPHIILLRENGNRKQTVSLVCIIKELACIIHFICLQTCTLYIS